MEFRWSWNGGRNGWRSFLLGFGWMPRRPDAWSDESWGLNVYLGPWLLTVRGR